MDEYIEIILNDLKKERFHQRNNGIDIYNKEVNSKYKEALRFLEIENIIYLYSDRKYELLELGKDVIKNNNNWKETIKENNSKIEIEERKSKIDLELAEQMLKEYPKTKWFARFGFFIGVILAIVQLIQWTMQLLSQ